MRKSTPIRKTLEDMFPTLDFTPVHPRKKDAVAELQRMCHDYPEFQFDENDLCVVAECVDVLLKVRADFDATECPVYQAQRISFCPEVVTSSKYARTPDDALAELSTILSKEAQPARRRTPPRVRMSPRDNY